MFREASRRHGWRTDLPDEVFDDPFYYAAMFWRIEGGMSEEDARADYLRSRVASALPTAIISPTSSEDLP